MASNMSADDWCKPDSTNAWNSEQPRLNILLKYMLERTVVPLKDGSSAILDADHKDILIDLEAVQKGQLKCDSSRGQSFRGYYMGWKGTIASKTNQPLIAIDPSKGTEKKIRLTHLVKTPELGGGSGSGSGSDDTSLFEGAACWVGAYVFTNGPVKVDAVLTKSELNSVSNIVHTDRSLNDIHQFLMDNNDWMVSSNKTANALWESCGKNRGTQYHWYRGTGIVNRIDQKYKDILKDMQEKPFSDINKWNPADIWLCNCSSPEIEEIFQWPDFISWNYCLRRMVAAQKLVGVSLKKVPDTQSTANLLPTNFGETKTPVKNKGVYAKSFSSIDMYVGLSNGWELQLRDTAGNGKSWQGDLLGGGAVAKGGRIGGGLIDKYMRIVYGEQKGVFYAYSNDAVSRRAQNKSPGSALIKSIQTKAKRNWRNYAGSYKPGKAIKEGNIPKTVEEYDTVEQKMYERIPLQYIIDKGPKWRYSKYLGLTVADTLLQGSSTQRDEISNLFYLYGSSQLAESGPFIKAM